MTVTILAVHTIFNRNNEGRRVPPTQLRRGVGAKPAPYADFPNQRMGQISRPQGRVLGVGQWWTFAPASFQRYLEHAYDTPYSRYFFLVAYFLINQVDNVSTKSSVSYTLASEL